MTTPLEPAHPEREEKSFLAIRKKKGRLGIPSQEFGPSVPHASNVYESIWIYLYLSELVWICMNLKKIYMDLSESVWIYMHLSEFLMILTTPSLQKGVPTQPLFLPNYTCDVHHLLPTSHRQGGAVAHYVQSLKRSSIKSRKDDVHRGKINMFFPQSHGAGWFRWFSRISMKGVIFRDSSPYIIFRGVRGGKKLWAKYWVIYTDMKLEKVIHTLLVKSLGDFLFFG